MEMYAHGLSTRDIEAVFADETGQSLLNRKAVSQITERLWVDYEAFASRDLWESEVVYLFVDGLAERLHLGQPREAVLAVSDGTPGMIRAIEECFPRSNRQRCLAHKLRNLQSKVPDDAWPEFQARNRFGWLWPR